MPTLPVQNDLGESRRAILDPARRHTLSKLQKLRMLLPYASLCDSKQSLSNKCVPFSLYERETAVLHIQSEFERVLFMVSFMT